MKLTVDDVVFIRKNYKKGVLKNISSYKEEIMVKVNLKDVDGNIIYTFDIPKNLYDENKNKTLILEFK